MWLRHSVTKKVWNFFLNYWFQEGTQQLSPWLHTGINWLKTHNRKDLIFNIGRTAKIPFQFLSNATVQCYKVPALSTTGNWETLGQILRHQTYSTVVVQFMTYHAIMSYNGLSHNERICSIIDRRKDLNTILPEQFFLHCHMASFPGRNWVMRWKLK